MGNNYKFRNKTNLPKRVVASSLVGIDEKFLSRATRPELTRELEKNLCVHHNITLLYGFRFPFLLYKKKKKIHVK